MPATWHVLRTAPHREIAVAERLPGAYVPLAERWVRGYLRRRRELTDTPLLSRYVFVAVPVADWGAVLAADGVTGVLCMNGAPAIVRDAELAGLRKAARRPPIAVGSRVEVEAGPFAGRLVEVRAVDMAKRSIMTDAALLGRVVPVQISVDQLALA